MHFFSKLLIDNMLTLRMFDQGALKEVWEVLKTAKNHIQPVLPFS